MKRITTDDLLREAAETRFVRRNELVPLLLEALERDEAARTQLVRLIENVIAPAKQANTPQIEPGFAWLPTFEWERDGDNLFLKITDVERVRFRWRVVDEEGKAYTASFGEHGIYLVPDDALDRIQGEEQQTLERMPRLD